jgi:hypothetical protein
VDTHLELGSRREHAELRDDTPHAELSTSRLIAVGAVSGIAGGIAMAAPIVIWDWVHDGHRALELPMAATAWLFGLEHFSNDGNLWWPIVIGVVLLAVYWVASGIAFVGMVDRFFRLSSTASLLGAGVVWSFASFVFFWTMLLPIARDGAPFREPTGTIAAFTAPDWVWTLGFTLLGPVTALCYAVVRWRTSWGHEERHDTHRAGLARAA